MKIHTIEQVSPNMSWTPEKYLLCSNVVIGRTGVQEYSTNEIKIGVDGDSSGKIYVTRSSDDVFTEISINSYNGKPVTNLHPDKMVSPENWKDVTVGVVQNVRRENELLVADLMITDSDTIGDIQTYGLREVSCGYDAEYIQTSPGYAYQQGIVGNHVALVPRGRCGATCSIKDSEMAKLSWKDKILALVKTKDEEGIKKVLDDIDEPAGGDLHIHMASEESKDEEKKEKPDPMEERVKKMEDAIASMKDKKSKDSDEEDEDEDKDEDKGESATADSIKSIISRAEILSPGIKLKIPTGDAKSTSFRDAVCGCKRQALVAAYATDAGRAAIAPFADSVDKLTGASLDAVFAGAAAFMAAKNNLGTLKTVDVKHVTLDDINKLNADFWAKRK